MKKFVLLSAAAALLSLPTVVSAQDKPATVTQAQQQKLTLERVFASPDLSGSAPRGVRLSPDGKLLTLLRGREDEKDRFDLWALDTQTGDWRMLVDSEKVGSGAELSEAEKMQRERKRIGSLKGIVAYDWAPDGKAILVPIDGDLYLARLDGSVERLTQTEASELNPAISPAGGYVSFVRDGQLWAGALGGEAHAITPIEGDTVHWGEAEFVAQEEMDRSTGYWWSPDDKRIAVERFDEAPVGIVTRAAIGAEGTKVYEQRYPAAGTDNVLVDLYVVDPVGQKRVKVDLGADRDIYLARVDWAPDGKTLYVQRENRAQTQLDMLSRRSCNGYIARPVQREGRRQELGQPQQQLQIPQRRQPDLVVRTRRLRASLSVQERQMDAADQGRLGRHRAGRRRSGQGPRLFFGKQGRCPRAAGLCDRPRQPGKGYATDRPGIYQRRVDGCVCLAPDRQPVEPGAAVAGLSCRHDRQADRLDLRKRARCEPPLCALSGEPCHAELRHDQDRRRRDAALQDDDAADRAGEDLSGVLRTLWRAALPDRYQGLERGYGAIYRRSGLYLFRARQSRFGQSRG